MKAEGQDRSSGRALRAAGERAAWGLLLLLCLACAQGSSREQADETYLRWMAFEAPGREHVLLRWQERDMPLRIHLPAPPADLFDDPAAIRDSVKDGVLDWTSVASSGIPRFEFVDDPGDADIPIVWEAEPDGDWYIAHCVLDVNLFQRRFGVARILVTGRWQDRTADLHDIYATVLHEMGHALGLGGHSPWNEDIMYPSISREASSGLSARDRATLAALYTRPVGARMTGARTSQ
ncbi:MAG: matrixin family metalloprotease [Myxococcota bacterium]